MKSICAAFAIVACFVSGTALACEDLVAATPKANAGRMEKFEILKAICWAARSSVPRNMAMALKVRKPNWNTTCSAAAGKPILRIRLTDSR